LTLRNSGNGRVGGGGRINFGTIEGLSCDDTDGDEGVLLWDKEFETYCDVNVGSSSDVDTAIKIEIQYNYAVSEEATIYYKDRGS